MNRPIATNPVADLPENWQNGQIVSPIGTDVGLSAKHGYNYQSGKINEALEGVAAINSAFDNIHNVAVYTGSSAPASSLGSNGDIYIQVE
jgi:hypothetical protein